MFWRPPAHVWYSTHHARSKCAADESITDRHSTHAANATPNQYVVTRTEGYSLFSSTFVRWRLGCWPWRRYALYWVHASSLTTFHSAVSFLCWPTCHVSLECVVWARSIAIRMHLRWWCDGQVLKRNRDTHTRTMWTKAKDSALKQRAPTSVMTSTSLSVDDEAAYRDQLNQLREENIALREALGEVSF